jgi:hypothetical protein
MLSVAKVCGAVMHTVALQGVIILGDNIHSVIKFNVIMLNVVLLRVILLNVIIKLYLMSLY